jgi:membrane protein required for colicin V production
MQTYDLVMVLVLVAATMFGFWKGMAWQIASLASLFVSYIASLKFSAQLAPVFGQQAPLNRFAAMLAIYVGTSFFIWTLFRFVSKAIDKIRLEAFDKQLGAMFGFAKGVLLCVAITFFAVTLLPPTQGEAIVGSQSGHYIVALLDKAHAVVPPELHDVIEPYLNKIEQRLNPNFQPHGQDMQQLWQAHVQPNLPVGMPQIPWPQVQTPPAQNGWPTSSQPQPQQPAWPTSSQNNSAWPSSSSTQQRMATAPDPYGAPQPNSSPYPANRGY